MDIQMPPAKKWASRCVVASIICFVLSCCAAGVILHRLLYHLMVFGLQELGWM